MPRQQGYAAVFGAIKRRQRTQQQQSDKTPQRGGLVRAVFYRRQQGTSLTPAASIPDLLLQNVKLPIWREVHVARWNLVAGVKVVRFANRRYRLCPEILSGGYATSCCTP